MLASPFQKISCPDSSKSVCLGSNRLARRLQLLFSSATAIYVNASMVNFHFLARYQPFTSILYVTNVAWRFQGCIGQSSMEPIGSHLSIVLCCGDQLINQKLTPLFTLVPGILGLLWPETAHHEGCSRHSAAYQGHV